MTESEPEPEPAAEMTEGEMDEPGDSEAGLTHFDEAGRVRMVDVSGKPVSRRRAVAEGTVRMRRSTLDAILAGEVRKGEALTVARLAAVQGAKRTPDLIPLCHPLPLESVQTEIVPEPELPGIRLRVTASAEARTGVEMEALTGVAVGLLALYDMCKARDRGMTIGPIRLIEKTGGRSGRWRAEADSEPSEPSG